MRKFSAVSAIWVAAALGASGTLWASSPPGPATVRAANAAVIADVSPLEKVHVAKFEATNAASVSGPSESQQPDTALMLMAGLGVTGTVIFRVSKR